jgi:hypothetical protein
MKPPFKILPLKIIDIQKNQVQKKEMELKMEVQIKVVIRVEKREVLWKQIKPIKD